MISVWKFALSKAAYKPSTFSQTIPAVSNSLLNNKNTTNHLLFNNAGIVSSNTIIRTKKDSKTDKKKADALRRTQQKEHQKKLEQKKLELEQRSKERLAAKRASKDVSELTKQKPPSLEKLYPKKKISAKYIAETAKSPSYLNEFVYTKKNVDVSKSGEDTGFFGLKIFKDATSMRDSLVIAKAKVDDLVKSIENGENVSASVFELNKLRFEYSTALETFAKLHPFEDLAALALGISDNFSQFVSQRALSNEKFYRALKQVETSLTVPVVSESRNLYASADVNRDKFTEAKDAFEKAVKDLTDYIENNSISKVRGGMKIYELNPIHYESMKKEVAKKKKLVVINLEKDLDAILTNVTEESLRSGLYEEAVRKFMTGSDDNQFNSLLSTAIDAANAFAKLLGYPSFVELKAASCNMGRGNIPKLDDVIQIVGELRDKLDIKREVEKLSELKITRMNDPVLKKCYYNKTKQTPEELKLFTPGFDIKQLSNLYYNRIRVNYLPADVENYLSLTNCLDALSKTLASDLFGVELVPEKLAPSETWSPLNIKRLNVVSQGKVVGKIYLDLFDREKTFNYDHYSYDKAKFYPSQGEDSTKSAVIQMYLRDHIYSFPNSLTIKQFRSLSGTMGQALFYVLHETSAAALEVNLLSNVIRKVFERLPQQESFLSAHLCHKGSRQPIPEEYAAQIASTPREFPLNLLQQLVYSVYEMEVFKPIDATQSTPIEILTSIESRFCKPYTQLVPNLSFYSKSLFNLKNQPLYLDLYAEVCAAHIAATCLPKDSLSKFSSLLKNVLTTEASTQPLDSVQRLLGANKPDVSYFIKEIQQQ
ncbi:hypothetical protein FDP41_006863 [Naegleria fowleri]|uniref:Peptidase M3A/M3B catalytic domain-containing protein n=1 Tax=Naegleria fowleri TaxID=5763 RepID=A0A6A5B6X7_NAEFO|nr:uncharacterized protein FDP41_006863 [Naegleria fowleri]KAF0974253.1 hypothetical protein FDP41_006863 [Naegleria fowleri]CAG4709989.1 unnamed protein product [Naegleria fowleri]